MNLNAHSSDGTNIADYNKDIDHDFFITDDNDLYPITDFIDDYEIDYPSITSPFLSEYSQSQITTELDIIDFRASYPFLENAYDDFIVLPDIADFEIQTTDAFDATELSNVLLEELSEDTDLLYFDHLPDSPVSHNSSPTISHNTLPKEQYELLLNYEEIIYLEILQEDLIYTSELG